MKRDVQSGVIAGDIPYFCIRNTLAALVFTIWEHKVKRPLIICATGNVMSITLKNSPIGYMFCAVNEVAASEPGDDRRSELHSGSGREPLRRDSPTVAVPTGCSGYTAKQEYFLASVRDRIPLTKDHIRPRITVISDEWQGHHNCGIHMGPG
uniref:Uncharacterized protein n=1 Tax=Trichuris muris TaxID=70415 RepID=A0A5S6QR26_TRIMR